MDREYDIFERVEGGRLIWRGHVSGIETLSSSFKKSQKTRRTNVWPYIWQPVRLLLSRTLVEQNENQFVRRWSFRSRMRNDSVHSELMC